MIRIKDLTFVTDKGLKAPIKDLTFVTDKGLKPLVPLFTKDLTFVTDKGLKPLVHRGFNLLAVLTIPVFSILWQFFNPCIFCPAPRYCK